MRLGDLDALKEQFTEGAYTSKGVRELIDNAPIVDIKDQIAGAYNEGYMCGNKEAEKARPQGEWIDTGNMEEYWAEEYQCSVCGEKDHWHNFCPNCGAKMKGDAKE